jgi:hypothetical protein
MIAHLPVVKSDSRINSYQYVRCIRKLLAGVEAQSSDSATGTCVVRPGTVELFM